MAAAVPAIIGLVGTALSSAVALSNKPPKPIRPPKQGPGKFEDTELRDAMRRRGRQTFVGDTETIVTGAPIGASTLVGSAIDT